MAILNHNKTLIFLFLYFWKRKKKIEPTMSELNNFEVLDTQEMNNNLQKSKELEETTSHQPCFLERLANDICRNYNWIIVLMLTPISLSYDFYCFGKYYDVLFFWREIFRLVEFILSSQFGMILYVLNFSKFLVYQHILNHQDQPWRWSEKHTKTNPRMEEDWNEAANVFGSSIMEVNFVTKSYLQR